VRLLLDTHVAVWSVSSSQRLPARIVELLADPENAVFVSTVSLWEIALKNASSSRDRMPFGTAVGAFRFSEFGYETLGLLPTHAIRFEDLPVHHGDPFDRMLIAQALVEQLQLVTHDRNLSRYDDQVILF
jgi:PIN domain nuclease of toxin-antitoxin system